MNSFVGCRFIMVDAKTGAREFYEKIGFKTLIGRVGRPYSMFLDFSDTRKN